MSFGAAGEQNTNLMQTISVFLCAAVRDEYLENSWNKKSSCHVVYQVLPGFLWCQPCSLLPSVYLHRVMNGENLFCCLGRCDPELTVWLMPT